MGGIRIFGGGGGGPALTDYQNVVVVDAGGNGDYTTLSAALAAITDDDANHRYTIHCYGVEAVSHPERPYIAILGQGNISGGLETDRYFADDAGANLFHIQVDAATFDGVKDNVWGFYYNGDIFGNKIDATKPLIGFQIETDYYAGGQHYIEYSFNVKNRLGTADRRYIGFQADRDNLDAGYFIFLVPSESTMSFKRSDTQADILRLSAGYVHVHVPILHWSGGIQNAAGTDYMLMTNYKYVYLNATNDGFLFGLSKDCTLHRTAAAKLETNSDIKFSASSVGPVLTDTADGHTYRLRSTNGSLVLQQVA